MTDNKGDLISREALKDATKQLYNETLDGIVKFGIEKVYDLIDNAPTIMTNEYISALKNAAAVNEAIREIREDEGVL